MKTLRRVRPFSRGLILALLVGPVAAIQDAAPLESEDEPVGVPSRGERVRIEDMGPGRIVNLRELSRLEAANRAEQKLMNKVRNGAQGSWVVPGPRTTTSAHSGEHYLTNEYGDTRMGVSFGEPVDLAGAWVAGQTNVSVSTEALRVIGYRDGSEVARTEWLETEGLTPLWFAMDLDDVDRVVFEARPRVDGAGWFALDDLAFERGDESVVLDFEDLAHKQRLSSTEYAGLSWETGTGDFVQPVREVPAPRVTVEDDVEEEPTHAPFVGGLGTAPTLLDDFPGARLGNPGANSIPPDTCGAAGIDYFVEVVNSHVSILEKDTGMRVVNASLNGFLGVPGGDPRVVYDVHSGRWFVIATNFNNRIYLAASMTGDPTGNWFSTSIFTATGVDNNKFPDYPTLGVDENGLYTCATMFGPGTSLTIWAIDKAPLIAPMPSLGTVTAFRGLTTDSATHPCVTYGTPGVQYLISRHNSNGRLRVREISGPITSPTHTLLGPVPIPNHASPPDAPAMGSTVGLDSVGPRLMNAVYRNGHIWTTHSIGLGGRAAVRWYQVDPLTLTSVQMGTISDPELYYIMPSIAVNAADDVVIGFSGSSANQFAGAYVTGRLSTDPTGEMGVPFEYHAGLGSYQILDGAGRNRWGDYSLTSVDPVDDMTFWTVQEWPRSAGNSWGTWIAKLDFGQACGLVNNYCATSPNSATLGAIMDWSGSVNIADNNFNLVAMEAPADKPGLFYYGSTEIQTPFGDGFRCVGQGATGTFRLYPFATTDAQGTVTRQLDFTAPPASTGSGQILGGATWKFQYWFRDPMGPGGNGFNLTDGLSVTFCP